MKKMLSLILSAAVIAVSPCITAFAEPVPDIAYVPKWNEQTVYEQFRSFKVNDSEYVSTGKEINTDSLGEKISDIEMSGYDIYEDKTYCAYAETYEIKNISCECAAAVKIKGNENIVVYKNYNYFPDTLGELIDALDLENTASFGTMYLNKDKKTEEYDREAVMSLLTENRDLKLTENTNINHKKISISTNVELLGTSNKYLSITDDGYISTNIMEWGYDFYIGRKAVLEIADMLGMSFEDDGEPVVPPVTEIALIEKTPEKTYPIVTMTTAGYVPGDTTVTSVKEDSRESVFMKGDISGDGKITVSDAVIMQKYLTKQTDVISSAADLNCDNKVNVFDYVSLRQIILSI